MKKLQMFIFIFFGIITFLVQFFGIWIILALWGSITRNWVLMAILGSIYLGMDIWRHLYYKRKGYTPSLGGYKAPEKTIKQSKFQERLDALYKSKKDDKTTQL